ncbi:MAG: formimidoylglutamate deiminase [Frankiaceae bacterium]
MPLTAGPPAAWWAEHAWLGSPEAGAVHDVLIETAGERIAAVRVGVPPPAGAARLRGLTLPGMANAHSHAFHRALRGRTHAGAGDFWAWREVMYEVAARLDPDGYYRLARAAYAEMALAGITAVGEFHYLHHDRDGRPYADPNAMAGALVAAAADAGVRLTLLDACYLQADVDGSPLAGLQLRFGDGDGDRWAARVRELRATATSGLVVGVAVHSVRAVPAAALPVVADLAAELAAPLHVHLSEQRRENAACLAATGRTPAGLLAAHGVLGDRTTAVHATHLTDDDVRLLGESATAVCLCPTTERDLADGVGPARRLVEAGSRLCLGSDSQAVVDLLEEARAVELDERLVTERRGSHRAGALLAAACAGGAAALGRPDAGRIAPGALADLVTVGLGSPRLAGAAPGLLVEHVVFAATAADVTDVVVGGRPVVRDGRHLAVGDVGAALASAIGALTGD